MYDLYITHGNWGMEWRSGWLSIGSDSAFINACMHVLCPLILSMMKDATTVIKNFLAPNKSDIESNSGGILYSKGRGTCRAVDNRCEFSSIFSSLSCDSRN